MVRIDAEPGSVIGNLMQLAFAKVQGAEKVIDRLFIKSNRIQATEMPEGEKPTKCGRGSEARPGIARIKLSGGQFEAPNTKLMGPLKRPDFYLYVILDIGRRRVVGWRIEHAESAIGFKAPRRRHGA